MQRFGRSPLTNPSSSARPPWRIALITDRSGATRRVSPAAPEMAAAVAAALEMDGHWVHIRPIGPNLPEALLTLQPHIAYNLSYGRYGDAPAAQVPALAELLDIPYTGSRILASALAAEPEQLRHLWRGLGLPVAGASGGPGQLLTVGLMGNPGEPSYRRRPALYRHGGELAGFHFFPILSDPGERPAAAGRQARLADAQLARLRQLAVQATTAVDVCDVAVVTVRLADDGSPALVALDTLPDLTPNTGLLARLAAAGSLPYGDLVNELLYLAAERYGLAFDSASPSDVANQPSSLPAR